MTRQLVDERQFGLIIIFEIWGPREVFIDF